MSNEYPPYGGSHSGDRNQADDGEPWPAYPTRRPAPAPYSRPETIGRQIAPIVLVYIVISVVLFCGSGIAVLALWNVGNEGIAEDPGGPTLLIVEEGQPFRIDGFEVEDGWRVGSDPDRKRRTTVLGLEALNTADDANTVEFDISFYADGKELGSIMCMSDLIEPGQSANVDCSSIRRDVSGYDEIDIIGTWLF